MECDFDEKHKCSQNSKEIYSSLPVEPKVPVSKVNIKQMFYEFSDTLKPGSESPVWLGSTELFVICLKLRRALGPLARSSLQALFNGLEWQFLLSFSWSEFMQSANASESFHQLRELVMLVHDIWYENRLSGLFETPASMAQAHALSVTVGGAASLSEFVLAAERSQALSAACGRRSWAASIDKVFLTLAGAAASCRLGSAVGGLEVTSSAFELAFSVLPRDRNASGSRTAFHDFLAVQWPLWLLLRYVIEHCAPRGALATFSNGSVVLDPTSHYRYRVAMM